MAQAIEARVEPAALRGSHEERNAQSERRLLEAAIALIAEKGFEKTTAAEIGVRAGYSRNMIRDRYGSKDALLTALCDHEFGDRLLPAIARERTGTGLELTLGQVDDMRKAFESEPERMRAVIVLAFEAPGPVPAIRDWWAAMMARYEEVMRGHLAAGQQDGSVRADLDPAEEAEVFVSYGIGVCYRWAIEARGYDVPAALARWRKRLAGHLGAA